MHGVASRDFQRQRPRLTPSSFLHCRRNSRFFCNTKMKSEGERALVSPSLGALWESISAFTCVCFSAHTSLTLPLLTRELPNSVAPHLLASARSPSEVAFYLCLCHSTSIRRHISRVCDCLRYHSLICLSLFRHHLPLLWLPNPYTRLLEVKKLPAAK